jgi:hypothetical protein
MAAANFIFNTVSKVIRLFTRSFPRRFKGHHNLHRETIKSAHLRLFNVHAISDCLKVGAAKLEICWPYQIWIFHFSNSLGEHHCKIEL